jgi:hypothetical protein
MQQHSSLRLRGRRAHLLAPAFLALLSLGCSSGRDPGRDPQALAREFPLHARAVLAGGGGFARDGGRFLPAGASRSGFGQRPAVELPLVAEGGVLFHGARGFAARVHEVGAEGAGEIREHAVVYPREGGTSYWTTTSGGVEEWIHLGPGRATAAHPALSWQVEGATARLHGAAVELAGADGVARLRVTAPVAYTADGRAVPLRLAVVDDAGGAGATIELYVDAGGAAVLVDPIWLTAGSLTMPLYDHREATLGNGTILIAGGTDGGVWPALPEAMLYTPSTDSWADTSPMNTPRNCHTLTALADGSALVAGGYDPGGYFVGDVELYDPVAASWSYQPNLTYTRLNHATTRLSDGTILVTGGRSDTASGGNSDIPQGLAGGSVPQMIGGGGSVPDVFGGSGSGGPGGGVTVCNNILNFNASTTATVEMFDPTFAAGGWHLTQQMQWNRERHTATLLTDGKVLVTGGANNGWINDSSEIYDPTLDSWSFGGWMSNSRVEHTATLLNDGTVLIVGGFNDQHQLVGQADNFAPNYGGGGSSGSGGPGSWYWAGYMNYPRAQHTASLLPDGTVLVAGGTDGFSSIADAEVYDPLEGTWTIVPSMAAARAEHTATALPGGGILVAGGKDDLGQPLAGAEIYLWSLPLGFSCEGGAECQSGFCADGVCCDTDCGNNACNACTASLKGNGVDGVCGPRPAGSGGNSEYCNYDSPDTCGETGVCDGAGNCALFATGTVCNPPYCVGNFLHDPDTCDGGGTCGAGTTHLCDPGVCTGTSCRLDCKVDDDCALGAYCAGNTCAPLKPLGQPATKPQECQSGVAVDGVCCDAPCTGTCSACTASKKGGGADGTCGPVKVGTDPDSECPTQGATSCGSNGACDGAGACAFYPAGTVCAAAACVGSTSVQPSLCDGTGTCVPGGALSCDPAGCLGGVCLSGCTTDPQCVGSAYCSANTCVPQKALGQPATGTNECLSGTIADGVCCNLPCTGTCVACTALLKGGGVDGVCGPIKAGSDPGNECANQGAASCGTSGSCDGLGACALYPSGTQCAAASCAGNQLHKPSQCDGAGSCLSQGTVTCTPGVCAGGTCQGGCVIDADCASNAFCAAGKCNVKLPLGQPAPTPNQCQSGHTADGVCCDVSCVGTCTACTAAKKGSGADGTCGSIQAGSDPDVECTDQGATSCGAIGACSGSGSCALYPSGTVCSAPSCQGTQVVPSGLCDGLGSCVVGKASDCAPSTCAGGICQAACVTDGDCIATAFCAAGNCAPKQPLGQPATGPNECLSGYLADGICCNTACTGTCVACTHVKKGLGADGTCGTIQAGKDPDDECSDQGTASCGTTGSCDGQGACGLYPAGTVCAAGACEGAFLVQPNLCDGSGTCVVGGTTDCSPAMCANLVCATACLTDDDCMAGTAFCSNAGVCQAKKPVGSPALGNNECLTGFQADGVCCSTACAGGPCDACSVSAGALVDGECAPKDGVACDDGDPCTTGDTCSGATCVGATPKDCPPLDACHDQGACDTETGNCIAVPKADGATCDDSNPCTVDACKSGVCVGVSVLDGKPCPGGVCIAGTCLLDPTVTTSSSSSSTSTGSSTSTSSSSGGQGGAAGTGGATGTGGVGGDVVDAKAPQLTGAGCLSMTPAGTPAAGGGVAAFFAALLAGLRRRTRRGDRGRRSEA